jgi:hypothetical protein
MKRSLVKFSLLFILLATMPQLSSGSAFGGQNANSSTTTAAPAPAPNPCRRRCMVGYRRCLRAAGNDPAQRKACAMRYRVCLRHCGRRG